MQGRLSASETGALQEFPRLGWEEEFPRAAAAGLSAIEWLYDDARGGNPLETDAGIARLKDLSAANGVEVCSLCAHWFVRHPLRDKEFDRLELVLARCAAAGIPRIVLPFLEAGSIDDEGAFATTLRLALASAERSGTELLVESSLEPRRLATVLAGIAHPLLRVNYDSGHAAPSAIAVLGPWIRGVHLKDRDGSGANVPIGTGSVDFEAVLDGLAAAGFSGDLVLETPRPRPGEEIAAARQAVAFIEQHLR
jgi:L-ribulose-5-phosphate 3-epimerase